jgi:hypothetical protein
MMSWITQNWSDIVKVFLLAFLIIAPTIAVFTNRGAPGAAIIAAVAAAALLLTTRLPDISEFKLLALTVKLQRQSQQIEVTLQQLQRLAIVLAKESLNQLVLAWGPVVMDNAEKIAIRNEIVESLRAIYISPDDIFKAQSGWIFGYCNILATQIEKRVKEIAPNTDPQQELQKLANGHEREKPLSPDTLREWLKSKSLNDPDLNQLLQEYDNVYTTGDIKHPDLIPPGAALSLPPVR